MSSGFDPSGSIAASAGEKSRLACDGLGGFHPVRLALETLAVTVFALGAVRWLHGRQIVHQQWLLIPAVLVFSALTPSWLGRRGFASIGLTSASLRPVLLPLAWVCGATLPAMIAGLWLMRHLQIPLPLAPVVDNGSGWLGWLLYQFLYVAVAEEVFFRGYVQSNIMSLCRRTLEQPSVQVAVTLIVSAGCFALAHVVVQGSAVPLLTFFPGLLMAWLYWRTGALIAPILFHGLANAAYGLAAALLS